MSQTEDSVIQKMQKQIQQWEETADRKAIFLRCYQMMTINMLAAIEKQQFNDPLWVDLLLHRFADYYFIALEHYEKNPVQAPQVWQVAHNAAQNSKITPLQILLLGVNAHINYDLVLTLVEILQSEWPALPENQRQERYADHSHVNLIIGQTIDSVQDQVLEPAMPVMDLIDKILGPADEFLISNLIARWRTTVWENATELLDIHNPEDRKNFILQIESDALRLANIFV